MVGAGFTGFAAAPASALTPGCLTRAGAATASPPAAAGAAAGAAASDAAAFPPNLGTGGGGMAFFFTAGGGGMSILSGKVLCGQPWRVLMGSIHATMASTVHVVVVVY